jgi:hypothetical protein
LAGFQLQQQRRQIAMYLFRALMIVGDENEILSVIAQNGLRKNVL